MLRPVLVLLCAASTASAADDAWAKVKELKSGTELRVYKRGSMQPLLVKMGDINDENLVIVDRNKETAIPLDQIDRIDARPTGKRLTTESKTSEKNPATDPRSTIPGPNGGGGAGPTTSTSSGVSFGNKPDFETVYRRPTGGPPKK
jgi:hypothetical protein